MCGAQYSPALKSRCILTAQDTVKKRSQAKNSAGLEIVLIRPETASLSSCSEVAAAVLQRDKADPEVRIPGPLFFNKVG